MGSVGPLNDPQPNSQRWLEWRAHAGFSIESVPSCCVVIRPLLSRSMVGVSGQGYGSAKDGGWSSAGGFPCSRFLQERFNKGLFVGDVIVAALVKAGGELLFGMLVFSQGCGSSAQIVAEQQVSLHCV
jgi:hypothetical protein